MMALAATMARAFMAAGVARRSPESGNEKCLECAGESRRGNQVGVPAIPSARRPAPYVESLPVREVVLESGEWKDFPQTGPKPASSPARDGGKGDARFSGDGHPLEIFLECGDGAVSHGIVGQDAEGGWMGTYRHRMSAIDAGADAGPFHNECRIVARDVGAHKSECVFLEWAAEMRRRYLVRKRRDTEYELGILERWRRGR
jgi:hypothetical protein